MKFASCIVKGALRKLKNVGDGPTGEKGVSREDTTRMFKTEGSRRAGMLMAIYRGGFG